MKSIFVLLATTLLCASAQADVRTDTFRIEGPKAITLENALKAAGAVTTPFMDTSNLSVANLHCEAGYLERPISSGGGPFSKCTFSQTRAPHCDPGQFCPRYVINVPFAVQGKKATAINKALEDAGVKAQQGRETTSRFAIRVTCNNMWSGPARGTSCSIEVPGGM